MSVKSKLGDSWRVKPGKLPMNVIPSVARNLVLRVDEILRHPAIRRIPLNDTPKNRLTWVKLSVISLTVALALLTILSGCAGYRLGSTLPPDLKSIYVRPFVNKCNEPLLEIDAINATIAEFQKDATLRVVPADEADLVLESTLDALTLTPLRYSQADKAKPNEYRLTLHVSFVLKRARTREIMSEASVIGESTFAFIGNLTASKRAAIPAAAEDLAKRIVEKVVETW